MDPTQGERLDAGVPEVFELYNQGTPNSFQIIPGHSHPSSSRKADAPISKGLPLSGVPFEVFGPNRVHPVRSSRNPSLRVPTARSEL